MVQVGWRYWPHFKPHHYLESGPMPFGTAYVGFVGEEPVVHLGMSSMAVGRGHVRTARACRMVVKPEWQGAGVGLRFLNLMCQREWEGDGFIGRPTNTLFHTAHPGLVAGLTRHPRWRRISGKLWGGPRSSNQTMGGHFRAVAGFKYYGTDPES